MVSGLLVVCAPAIPCANQSQLVRSARVPWIAAHAKTMSIEGRRTRAREVRLHSIQDAVPELRGTTRRTHYCLPVCRALRISTGACLSDATHVA